MNLFNIERQFKLMKEKNWDTLYWLIDLHDVVIPGKFSKFNEGREFYPGAQEVLHWLSSRSDMKLILWTSSYADAIEDIDQWFSSHSIYFATANHNPFEKDTHLCTFRHKPYFNIVLDDKGGFEGEHDWLNIRDELKRLGQWHTSL